MHSAVRRIGSRLLGESQEGASSCSAPGSLHVPLSDETRGLIGARELAWTKPTAVLVNTSRGGVLDQGALVAALARGHLAAAALDVADREPIPAGDPLLAAPRLLLTPHIGSASIRTRTLMADLAIDNCLAVLFDRPMPHEKPCPSRSPKKLADT